jgi:hypothetical protein
MKRKFAFLLPACALGLLAAPEFTNDGQLKRPTNYREWIYLSSGLGMTYGPAAKANPNPTFDNVFVEPEAYRAFLATGEWPDKSMFLLEIRRSRTEGSINKGGNFQGDVVATEVSVKDVTRFPDGWGYFDFPRDAAAARVLPASAGCNSCHNPNGAVENTFVQFYPTLLEVARAKGTLKPSYLKGEPR